MILDKERLYGRRLISEILHIIEQKHDPNLYNETKFFDARPIFHYKQTCAQIEIRNQRYCICWIVTTIVIYTWPIIFIYKRCLSIITITYGLLSVRDMNL